MAQYKGVVFRRYKGSILVGFKTHCLKKIPIRSISAAVLCQVSKWQLIASSVMIFANLQGHKTRLKKI